jgi:hypothetical protein
MNEYIIERGTSKLGYVCVDVPQQHWQVPLGVVD